MKSLSLFKGKAFKTATVLTLLAIAGMSQTAKAEREKGGNGGDFIRLTFMDRGHTILDYLAKDADGKKVVTEHRLSLEELRSVLSTQVISVVTEELRDRTGSVVDALGEAGSIRLSYDAWKLRIFKGESFDRMVFHEMLRAVRVNDDDYRISKSIPNAVVGQSSVKTLPPVYRAIRGMFMEAKPLTVEDAAKLPQNTANLGSHFKCTNARYSGQVSAGHSLAVNPWKFGLFVFDSYLSPGRRWYSDFETANGMITTEVDGKLNVGYVRKMPQENPETDPVLLVEYVQSGFASKIPPSVQVPNMQAYRYEYCEMRK